MRFLWLLITGLSFLLIACSSKEDKAKSLAREVLTQIYEVKNYPQKFSDIYTLLYLVHSRKDGNMTYADIADICSKADKLYRDYKQIRESYSNKAKNEGVYEQYSQIMQTLFEKDCTYAPTMALYHRIDNFCENVRIADSKFEDFKQHKWAVEEAWEVFNRKFMKYYSEALKIKESCFDRVK